MPGLRVKQDCENALNVAERNGHNRVSTTLRRTSTASTGMISEPARNRHRAIGEKEQMENDQSDSRGTRPLATNLHPVVIQGHNESMVQQIRKYAFEENQRNATQEFVHKLSIQFVYSASQVLQFANAISMKAQKYINIGSGPCIPRLPQCLIIGNFKCGTRELLDFMSMHPRIQILSNPYEVFFFTAKYYRGLDWYKSIMPCSYSNQITVVKAPSYLQSDVAHGRIHKMNSSIKLIVLVREPVSRSLSQFTFHPNRMNAYNNSLKAAVTEGQSARVNPNSYFIKHSIYDEGMERYLTVFDRRQIKIIDSSDFKNDPYTVLYELEEFLNLEHSIRRDNIVYNQEKGFHCLRKDPDNYTAACYHFNRGRNSSEIKNRIKDGPELFEKLRKFFRPHNENFYKVVGKDFGW